MEDEAKAEAVRRALREAGLSDIASEFDVANLVKLHDGGYSSAKCVTVAREQDLYQCKLAPALVGLLLNSVGQLAGEFFSLRGMSLLAALHARSTSLTMHEWMT